MQYYSEGHGKGFSILRCMQIEIKATMTYELTPSMVPHPPISEV